MKQSDPFVDGVQIKEVILEDTDVSKALSEYAGKNAIENIVVGASSRGALARKFKNSDVPTSLMKSAPDFCTVYVISKGKVHYVRKALRPLANSATPPKMIPTGISPRNSADTGELEETLRQLNMRANAKTQGSERRSMDMGSDNPYKTNGHNRQRNTVGNISMESIDLQPQGRNSTSSKYDDFGWPGSMDSSIQKNLDFSIIEPGSPGESSTADELSEWKMEESRRFEEARQGEEAALAIAEMEKAKSKAAMEAAEAAQRLAELEAQRRKHAEMKAKKDSRSSLAQHDVRYRKYTIEEIEEATDKFANSNKIGEGGYGPVYKGKLDHTPVAIKVLRPDAAQGKKQFNQEIEVLCSIRHPNMVLLLGACPEYGCLVYEHMNQGSLEDRLFRRGNSPPISWQQRFTIAAEIATALLFLHQTKPEPLVHRDLKPANILLDRNFVSKISDVGLARLVPAVADNVTQYHMTSAAGTFCYIDPEYQQTGMLTTRSDIYSLGIMLLQIITAKPPMGLAHHVKRSIEKGNFETMLDPAVPDWPVEEALSFAKLSLKCAELSKKDRPDLGKVILPELNRLRDLGRMNDSENNWGHYHGHGQNSSSGRSSGSRQSRGNNMQRSPLSRSNVMGQV
ncbi:hypothetical protein ACFE04_014446 [Oxalis oulophora]